ncbi:S-adenosyl-L-methionine-dependent methyltransferase [Wilcoxina mikolae CBS 423.85]|nr:S-adenosyl-L-methionine-dependent methyltransferase [Wilcoxina mikolae CBS 423.85]
MSPKNSIWRWMMLPVESDTTSLSSSIVNRRYHAYKAGTYALPNDETEQDRLDMMHHIYLLLLQRKLHAAPLENPQRVLDIGTGTGIWVIDFADNYESAEVVGTDLSPIQPRWVPPNVQFLVDDAKSDWTFSQDSFDYIHLRGLCGAIQDWPRLLKQSYDTLKPGGYIESFEFIEFNLFCDDGTFTPDTALWRYYDLINKAATKSGRPFTPERPLREVIAETGFKNLQEKLFKCPLGTWPADPKQKELGRVLGIPIGEVKQLIDDCRAEVRGRKLHGHGILNLIVAQKPE